MNNPPIPPTGCSAKLVTADGVVKTGKGTCVLLLCTESTSLVLDIYDGTSTGGTKIVQNLAPYAGEEYDLPFEFTTGLYVEVVSGSGSVTMFYV